MLHVVFVLYFFLLVELVSLGFKGANPPNQASITCKPEKYMLAFVTTFYVSLMET